MTTIDELVRDSLDAHAEQAPPPGAVIARTRNTGTTPASRRLRTPAAVGLGAVAALTAFGVVTADHVGQDESTPVASEGASPTTVPSTPTLSRADKLTADIYAAMLSRALQDWGHDHGGVPAELHVVREPNLHGVPGDTAGPVPAGVQAAVTESLASLADITWVDRPDGRLAPYYDGVTAKLIAPSTDSGRIRAGALIFRMTSPDLATDHEQLEYFLAPGPHGWSITRPVPPSAPLG